MQIKRNINWFHLILSIVVVELIGSLSGLLAGNIKGIYTSLKLPPLSPPAAVFGPVWIILYLVNWRCWLLSHQRHDIAYPKNHQSQSFWQSTASQLHLEHRVLRRQ